MSATMPVSSMTPAASIRSATSPAPPYATNDRGFCIYLDARTDGFTIENNYTGDIAPGFAGRPLINQRLIRRDEIGDNHPGPNLIFKQ